MGMMKYGWDEDFAYPPNENPDDGSDGEAEYKVSELGYPGVRHPDTEDCPGSRESIRRIWTMKARKMRFSSGFRSICEIGPCMWKVKLNL